MESGSAPERQTVTTRVLCGFLTCIHCSSNSLSSRNSPALFSEHPITVVWLTGANRTCGTRATLLTRVRDIGVFRAHRDGLMALLASQFVTVLRGLHLQRLDTPTYRDRLADFFPILERPDLKHLTRLSLNFSGLDLHELADFVQLDVLSQLTELTLDSTSMGDTTARTLAASPNVAGLRVLRLRNSRLSDAGVALLAGSPHLSGLRRLSLFSAKNLTDAGLSALAVSPHLRNLTDLDLRYTEVTTMGANALIESPHDPLTPCLILRERPRPATRRRPIPRRGTRVPRTSTPACSGCRKCANADRFGAPRCEVSCSRVFEGGVQSRTTEISKSLLGGEWRVDSRVGLGDQHYRESIRTPDGGRGERRITGRQCLSVSGRPRSRPIAFRPLSLEICHRGK